MLDKTRTRRTKVEILELRRRLADIVGEHRPLTIRHLFYLAVSARLIEKTEADYQNAVIRLVGIIREEWLDLVRNNKQPTGAIIPFDDSHIVDAGRWIQKPRIYAGIEDALRMTADYYRRSLWHDSDVNVIIICEKAAVAELVFEVTAQWDVPLAVVRGFSSKTFLWQNAQAIEREAKDTIIYFLGDHDEAGDSIIENAFHDICRYAKTPRKIIHRKLAVTVDQIKDFGLPLHPSKPKSAKNPKYADGSVELDALPPEILRTLIRDSIKQFIDPRALEVMQAAEESERRIMGLIADNLPEVRRALGA